MGLRTLLQKVVSVASLDLNPEIDNGEDEIAFVQALLEQGAQCNLVEQCFHSNCVIVQEMPSDDTDAACPSFEEAGGAMPKNRGTLLREMSRLVASFPDIHYRFSVPRRLKPGVVVVDSCQGIGTHTGTPFSFGPYPPIDAKHVKVRCDPERWIFHLESSSLSDNETSGTWQVVMMETIPLGRFSGSAGFYQKIGGILF